MALLTYKQIVKRLTEVKTEDELLSVCREIDYSFQAEKINANDHIDLYKISSLILYGIRNK